MIGNNNLYILISRNKSILTYILSSPGKQVMINFFVFIILGIDEQNKRKVRPEKYKARRESISYPDMPYEEVEEELVRDKVFSVCLSKKESIS
jgi:hypothetical protein